MPSIPTKTKCSELGCKNTRSKYHSCCIEHGGRDTYNSKKYNASAERKKSNDMYQQKQWRALRQIQLSLHPLCASCMEGGRITPALHIDHVFPWHIVGEEAFYLNLFQSLCAPCHSSKTALEQTGVYRHYTIPIKDYSIEDYALVMLKKRNE